MWRSTRRARSGPAFRARITGGTSVSRSAAAQRTTMRAGDPQALECACAVIGAAADPWRAPRARGHVRGFRSARSRARQYGPPRNDAGECGERERDSEARERCSAPRQRVRMGRARRCRSTTLGPADRATGRRRTRPATRRSSRVEPPARERRRRANSGGPTGASRRAAPRREGRRTIRADTGRAGSSAGRSTSAPTVATRATPPTSSALRHARQQVLQADRSGVDVRERLIALVHGQREQGQHACGAARGDRGQQGGRVADVAGQRDHRAEGEQRDRRHEVAEPGAPEAARAGAGEPRVVGDERRPADHRREHEVEARPESVRACRDARAAPGADRAATTRRGRAATRSRPTPRTCARTCARTRPGRGRPAPWRRCRTRSSRAHVAEAEHLLRERARAGRDDDQLEHRPAEALHDVQAVGR